MFTVAAFYNFVDIASQREALRPALKDLGASLDIRGIILLADEGINGTISGPNREVVEQILAALPFNENVEVKWSSATLNPFYKFKVRLKKEIITMAAPEANPNERVGKYVSAQDWNDFIKDPDVIVLDTRNIYETEMGSFKGAVDPQIKHFSHFKDFVAQMPEESKSKKIAMFCTGGIRCEKASSYMMAHGFDEVYHLKGGILKYLETVPKDESLWKGACFVFDKRVALEHGLEEAIV